MQTAVVDAVRYAQHRTTRDTRPRTDAVEMCLVALVFGSMGAIAWAIRGTNGWGGIDGTIIPGMLWGILWYYLCRRWRIACHGVPLWLGLGIALGGELGYGQYVSWIQGNFYVGDEVITVAPAQGWLWFVLCGIGWGAPGGVFLGWALSAKQAWPVWLGRLVVPFAVAALGWGLVQWLPGLFFPNHGLGIYTGELDHHLERTVYTNTQNFTVVAWWAGTLLIAALQRDRMSLIMTALIGGGFGPGFALAALWCLGYAYAPHYIDWWKLWELQAGFNLGLLYTFALYVYARHADRAHPPDTPQPEKPRHAWCVGFAFETVAALLCVLAIFAEEELGTSLFLGVPLVVFACWLLVKAATKLDAGDRATLRGALLLLYTVFLFLFVLFHGAVSTLGLILELYPPEAVDQYDWPTQRIALFLPLAFIVTAWTLYRMTRTLWRGRPDFLPDTRLSIRITDMMTLLTAVGVISIWPSEVGALYTLCLCVGIWAFNRLNQRLDANAGAIDQDICE